MGWGKDVRHSRHPWMHREMVVVVVVVMSLFIQPSYLMNDEVKDFLKSFMEQ